MLHHYRSENTMKKSIGQILDFLKRSDSLLLVLCLAASIFGIVLIDSATNYLETNQYVLIQTAALILGLILYFVFTILEVDVLADKPRLLFAFSALFIGSLLFLGVAGDSGNRAWIRFGPVGIQPAEIVKIPFIIMMARLLTYQDYERGVNDKWSVVESVALFGFFFVLIIGVSSDLGSALVYFFIFATMIFVAGISYKWILAGCGALVAVMPIAWKFFLSDYQKKRILAPYVKSIDPYGLDVMWQANQSKVALASGQLTGQGLFQGTQTQSGSVPAQHTDFIFAVAGEELGLIGCLAIITLLLVIIWRCIHVGLRANDRQNGLICIGIAAMLIFQTFENIGMCIGLTPVVGLILPFFSYGGSSIITLFAAMGVVSSIKMRPKPNAFISKYD